MEPCSHHCACWWTCTVRCCLNIPSAMMTESAYCTWVRWRRCGCLVTWFCYHLIAKPGNKTATPSSPDPYHFLVMMPVDASPCHAQGGISVTCAISVLRIHRNANNFLCFWGNTKNDLQMNFVPIDPIYGQVTHISMGQCKKDITPVH